ncbi:MAG: glycosyltransferase family 2 protein [Chthoniobacterales bacterium]|nr:glycosyltransferase family 2 protein [Chthoniobacterales bacterium]
MMTIMIPALNEEAALADAVKSVHRVALEVLSVPPEIIVFNDGSTDRTAELAEQLAREIPGLRVVHHAKPMGVGFCFREALQLAKGDRFTGFAGDNNVAPRLITELLGNADKADVVVSYIVNTEERGSFRHVVSTLFSMTYVLFFGIHLKYINGNTVWPTQLLRECNIRARGYSIMAETNVKILRRGVTFMEIPGEMNKAATKSQAIKWKNLVEVIGTFFRLIWQVHFSQKEIYSRPARRISYLRDQAQSA